MITSSYAGQCFTYVCAYVCTGVRMRFIVTYVDISCYLFIYVCVYTCETNYVYIFPFAVPLLSTTTDSETTNNDIINNGATDSNDTTIDTANNDINNNNASSNITGSSITNNETTKNNDTDTTNNVSQDGSSTSRYNSIIYCFP